MMEEQELINFFTDKGWSKEDLNKHKQHLMAEIDLFSTYPSFTIEMFYDEVMSKCDADEYYRHQKHIWRHREFTNGLVCDLITAHRRDTICMFIMVILFAGYSFFIR